MKHLYSLIIMTLVVLGVASCSSDDYKYETTRAQITIQESDVLFKAEASSGTVKFTAPGEVTATSDKDWCHVTVKGQTLTVEVDENTAYEGRMATITLKYGDYKKPVYVQQNGVIIYFSFKDKTFDEVSDLGEDIVISGKITDEATIESDVAWLKPELKEDGLHVKVLANTGKKREGHVTIIAPKHDNAATLTFSQLRSSELPDPVIPGSYIMTFHTSKAEDATDLVTKNVTIRQDASDKKKFYLAGLLAPDFNYELPLVNDEEKQQLVMSNCNVIGTNEEFWLVPVCLYTTPSSTGTISYTIDATRAIYFDYTINDDEKYEITLHNSAKELINPDNNSKGFSIYNFSSDEKFSSSTRKTLQLTVRVPELKQVSQ